MRPGAVRFPWCLAGCGGVSVRSLPSPWRVIKRPGVVSVFLCPVVSVFRPVVSVPCGFCAMLDFPRSLTRRVGFEPASSRRQVLEGIDTRIYRALVDPKMLREHLHEFPERYPAFL